MVLKRQVFKSWKYLGPLHDLDHLLARQAVERGEQALGGVRLGIVVACIHDLGLDSGSASGGR